MMPETTATPPDAVYAFVAGLVRDEAERMGVEPPDDEQLRGTNLMASGLLSSLRFFETVAAVEAEFDVEIDFDDVDPAQLSTADGLAAAVSDLLGVGSAGPGAESAPRARLTYPEGVMEIEGGSPLLSEVEAMFAALYDWTSAKGFHGTLVEGGAELWRQSIEPTLGRNAVLLATEGADGRPTGFLHGTLRPSPDFVVGGRFGYVSHVFVHPDARGEGVGGRLVAAFETWVQDKGGEAVELEIVVGNEVARSFWERVGYGSELVLARKAL